MKRLPSGHPIRLARVFGEGVAGRGTGYGFDVKGGET